MRLLTICLCMILPVSGMAEEIPLSEHQKYTTRFDGVFMDESTYKDYVFKAISYERLSKDHDALVLDFEQYKDEATDACNVFQLPSTWFILGVVVTGFAVGYANGK